MSDTKVIIIPLILPPLGILFIWTKTKWNIIVKLIATIIAVFYTLLWFSFLQGFLGGFLRGLSK